jgi:heme/copper-type cytochrome/quinol oxidase subunit 3
MTHAAESSSSTTTAAGRVGLPLGKLGVWWFLASEITTFGGLITSYILVRLGSTGWSEEAAHLSLSLALINTLILLTSSMTMVMAFAAVKERDTARLRTFLLLTVFLGLGFLGVKAVEYTRELTHGFTPTAGLFWAFYYGMTGLHALHVLGGVIVNVILFFTVATPQGEPHRERVEFAGLYWHFVDVVWIFLFPLLYLT